MGIHEDILAWSNDKLTPWRRDALRRLCENGELTEADLDELYDLAKQHHGLAPATDPPVPPAPFGPTHFPSAPEATQQVSLTSLHSLQNVGLLVPGQSLDFHPTGLTVIYGGNGSGKSGYARILKQACRARSPGMVYANAFSPEFSDLIPTAKIDFSVDGTVDQADWVSRQASRAELRAVSVFDSDCADHYLRSQETATYQPTVFSYLQELALGISEALGKRIDAETRTLQTDVSPFNVVPEDTDAGKAVRPLTAKTDLGNLADLATLSAGEMAELESLPAEISEADPTTKAENQEHGATKVAAVAAELEAAKASVASSRVQELKEARQKLLDAEAAEKAAAGLLQADDPAPLLSGTGESVWTSLFRAAQSFSVGAAYPGQAFPAAEEGSRCVLCQQDLGPDAQARMARFADFINDTASSLASASRDAYKKQLATLAGVTLPALPSDTVLASLEKRSPGISQQIADLSTDLSARLQWLRECAAANAWTQEPGYSSTDPLPALAAMAQSLTASAKSLRENIDSTLLATKRSRLRELQARVTLGEHMPSIRKAVADLDRQAKLAKCKIDAAGTRGISTFAKQLAKSYISDSLASQMKAEVERLNLHHIDANVEFDGDYGAVRLRVLLPKSNLNPHLVLSEAEQRICSLAYFFAEQVESKSTSTIVFDDPVTSLDHNHRAAVARRIVEEAAGRQVIVFTHDAVFFGELQFYSEELKVAQAVRCMEYRAEGPGCIDESLPWDMRGHNDRISEHHTRQKQLAVSFNNPPSDIERRAVRNAYNDLRATLEIGIEDIVLNGTIERFRDGISVGRLAGVTQVEPEEFAEVETLHDRFCRQVSAHSHSGGQQRAVVQPGELLADIQAVDKLLKGIRARRNKKK
jgi:energy-coupling factor transporter ATP-binding protein EcfA2